MHTDQEKLIDETDSAETNSKPDEKLETAGRSLNEDRVNSAIYVFIDAGLSEPERSRAVTLHACRCQIQLHDRGLAFASAELIFIDIGDPSSKPSDRSARRQLLHCVAKGTIDVLAVDSIEHLGATPEDQTGFCAECQAGSVEVIASPHGRVRLEIAAPAKAAVDEHRRSDDAGSDHPINRQADEVRPDQPVAYRHASAEAVPKLTSIDGPSPQVLGPLVELYVAGYDPATVADIMNVLDLQASDGAGWTPLLVKRALSEIVRNSIDSDKPSTTGSFPSSRPSRTSNGGRAEFANLHPQRIGLLAKKLARDCGKAARFHAGNPRRWMQNSGSSNGRRGRISGPRFDRS